MLLNVADAEKINTDDFVKKDAISSSITSSSTTNIANSAAVNALNNKINQINESVSSGKWEFIGLRGSAGLWKITGGIKAGDVLILMPQAIGVVTFLTTSQSRVVSSSYGSGAPYFQFTSGGYRTANVMMYECLGSDVTLNIGSLTGAPGVAKVVAFLLRQVVEE